MGSVGEQSHKSEMGAALRGDFERLRARRGAGGEAVLQAPRPEPVAPAAAAAAPMPVPAPVTTPAPAPAEDEPAVQAQRPSWLDRLRGRR